MNDGGRVHSNDTFGKMPKELMHDHTITDGAKVLYAHMHWRYGLNHKNFESMASMAEILGVKEKTISRRIEELEKARWIVVLNRRKRGGNYTTNFYHVFESTEKCIAWLQAPDEIEEGDEIRLPLGDNHQTKMSGGRRTKKSDGRKTKMSDNTDSVVIQTQLKIGDKSQKAKAEPPQTPSLLDESTITQILHTINSGQSSTVENLLSFYSTDEEQLWHTLVEMEKRALIDLDGVTKTAYPRGTMVKPEITLDDFSTYVPDFSHKHSLKFTDVKEALLDAFKVQGEGTREHSLAGKTANELIAAQVHADEVQNLYDFVASELKKMGTTLFKVSALPNHVTAWRKSQNGKTDTAKAPVFDMAGAIGMDDES